MRVSSGFHRIPWDRVSEAAVLFLLAFSVLWRGGKSLDATWLLAIVAGAVTLLWWSGWKRHTDADETVPPLLWLCGLLFALWTLLSYQQSETANYGFDEVLRDIALVLLFFWAARAPLRLKSHAIRVLAFVTVISAVIGVAVYVLQPVDRFVGTFFDYRFHTDYWPNAYAEFLLLTWPIVWRRAFGDGIVFTGRPHRAVELAVRFCIVGLVFAALILTYSRGAMLAFIIQTAVAVTFWKRGGGVMADAPKFLARMGFVAVIALAFAVSINAFRAPLYSVQSWEEKATFQAAEGSSSVSERSAFWSQAQELFRLRPLFGWGPYSFRFVQQRLQTDVLETSDHPHNIFLKLAAERGFAALLLFLAVLALLLRRPLSVLLDGLILRRRNAEPLAPPGPTEAAIVTGILGVLAHNLIDYNLQFTGIALPFWLLAGFLVPGAVRHTPYLLNIKFVHLMEALLALLLLLLVFREGRFLVISSLGRRAEAAADPTTALERYNQAEREWFSRDLRLSQAMLLLQFERPGAAADAVDKYLHRNRHDPRGWKILGDIRLAQNDGPRALEAYRQAMQLGRWNDITIAYRLAETTLMLRGPEGLAEVRNELDMLLEAYGSAVERNAHFVALSQNVEGVIALAELMAEQFPDGAPWYQVLAAAADRNASLERSRTRSRPPGFLW